MPATRPITLRDLLTYRMGFGQMLLSWGKHGTTRLLSRLSVEVLTTDQLTPEQKAVSGLVPGFFDGHGWGLGLSIVTKRDDAVPGRYGWDGGLGTSWYSDPREEMVTILDDPVRLGALLPVHRTSALTSGLRHTRQSTTNMDLTTCNCPSRQ